MPNISPRVLASREVRFGKPGFKGKNSWERGIPKDSKGLPYLDRNGSAITIKEWSDKYRREFQEAGLA